MQHDMASITCPACQCSISVQQILQLHEKHQEAKRRLQLCESQTTILLAWKILDQGREADLQGDLAGAFQLYKEGLARALHAGKLWPATNPIVPMMDHFHSQTMWAMRRSEKISTALAAWASVSEHPHPMDVAQLSAAAAAQAGAPSQQGSSSRHKTGVALGTTQGEKPPQLEPVQPAQLPQPMHREFLQLKQVTQQQAQQPQKAAQQQAQHQVAQEPQQQQHRQPEVLDLVTVAGQQKQQQQQQQQPEHQHLQKQELGALRTPRQPLGPPPHELLKAKSKAVSDASTKAAKMTRWKEVGPQCVARGDSHQRKRAKMQDEMEEDHEKSDVDIWTFRELSKLELLRD